MHGLDTIKRLNAIAEQRNPPNTSYKLVLRTDIRALATALATLAAQVEDGLNEREVKTVTTQLYDLAATLARLVEEA